MSNNWIPISIQNESHVETRMCVTFELIVTVWWVIMSALGSHVANTYSLWQPLPSHVHLWRNNHPEVAQIHAYTHSVHIWLLLYSSCVLNFHQVLQSQRHCIPLPLTCSVCQPLPSHDHLWSNGQPKNRWNPSLYTRLPRVTENRSNTSLHTRHIFFLTMTVIPCVSVQK